jgi:thiol-disulfide isomerase/thioredoxin
VALFRPARVSENLGGLAFTDAGGEPVRLASFAGRAVLVNFWATWCVPCRAEMPALDRLAAERGGDDFQVVAVNLDTEAPVARQQEFLATVGVTHLPLYRDPKLALTADLRRRDLVFGLPTTLLVDAKSCRLGTAEGGAAWDSPDAKALIAAAAAGA